MLLPKMKYLILAAFFLLRSDSVMPQSPQAIEESQKAEVRIVDGYLFDRAGNRKEAIRSYELASKHYQRAADIDPEQAEFWKKLGFAYWLCDKKSLGLTSYEEALRLQPEDAESHFMIGLLQSNDPDAAIGKYREAARLKPFEAKYHVELGLALDQKKDVKGAIAAIEEAIRLDPENGVNHAILGGILLKNGEIEKAVPEYRKALALRVTDAEAGKMRPSWIDVLAMEKKDAAARDFDYWIRKTQDWQAAVAQHKPGERDLAAVAVGAWPIGDMEVLVGAVVELNGKKKPWKRLLPAEFRSGYPAYKKALAALLKFEDGPNSFLKKAALLHTDIALLRLETGKDDVFSSMFSLTQDGLGIAANGGQHWEFARSLLNSIKPDPSKDETVRQWYRATTAHMLNHRERAFADVNIRHALELFPGDAELLYYAGVLHESYAAPKSQNALPPPGMVFQFGSQKSELQLARRFFQQSLNSDSKFPEARLRLGRVAGLLGGHEEAVAELKKAAAAVKEPQLRYYVSLFLGQEYAALGRTSEARECFGRAAALYPAAQAPLLADSHLARSSGDLQLALRGVRRMFELPTGALKRNDPWWEYDKTHSRDSAALVAEMRSLFAGLPQ